MLQSGAVVYILKWNRAWKIRLIEEMNPEWKDLSEQAF
jgi:predicted GIY-YIG superfamily endonuclease